MVVVTELSAFAKVNITDITAHAKIKVSFPVCELKPKIFLKRQKQVL